MTVSYLPWRHPAPGLVEWVQVGGSWFAQLSREQARKYYNEFLATREDRIAQLELLVASSGIDLTGLDRREALAQLTVFVRRRAGRGARVRQALRSLGRHASGAYSLADSITLDAGIYLGEALVTDFPGLRWDLETDEDVVDYHRPVIAGFAEGLTLSPVTAAWRASSGDRGAPTLAKTYEEWAPDELPSAKGCASAAVSWEGNSAASGEVTIYDKLDYHLEGDFPGDLDDHQAAVPTGLYLAWIIERHLDNSTLRRRAGDAYQAVQTRQLTAPQLYERLGGVFSAGLLSPEGRAFTDAYFDFDHGDYLNDLEQELAADLPSLYAIADSWDSYDRLRHCLDDRYAAWKRVNASS